LPRDKTLSVIEREIAAGDLGKARDRLQGLLLTYPSDLSIRHRLGDVFWRLQYPEKAGQYWFLRDSDSEDVVAAKHAFERRFGDSPALMLHELRYRGGLEAIDGTYAGDTMRALARRAGVDEQALREMLAPRKLIRPRPNLRQAGVAVGLGFVGFTILLLILLGLINGVATVIRWAL